MPITTGGMKGSNLAKLVVLVPMMIFFMWLATKRLIWKIIKLQIKTKSRAFKTPKMPSLGQKSRA